MERNKLPFIQEDFTNNIKDLKSFIHANIYTDDSCINLLHSIIDDVLKPFNTEFMMDKFYKVINIKLKKTNIKKVLNDNNINQYTDLIVEILNIFFSNQIIINKLMVCNNGFKWNIINGDKEFMKLLFNITEISDNIIRVYL